MTAGAGANWISGSAASGKAPNLAPRAPDSAGLRYAVGYHHDKEGQPGR